MGYDLKKRIWAASKKYLSEEVTNELVEYLTIFYDNSYTLHWEVNEHISDNNLWDNFTNIRSRNTHESGYVTDGILPVYFAIVSEVLDSDEHSGSPLKDSEHY